MRAIILGVVSLVGGGDRNDEVREVEEEVRGGRGKSGIPTRETLGDEYVNEGKRVVNSRNVG